MSKKQTTTRERAEIILKDKLKNINAIDNADYTFNKIIEAMEQHASEAYEKGKKDAANEILQKS